MTKKEIHAWLLHAIEEREHSLAQTWNALNESNQQEGKSSSGDKHETGKAMVHLELEQLNKQQQEILRQKEEVLRASTLVNEKSDVVRLGSLVHTTAGVYYLATGWGKTTLNNSTIMIIGLQSPVGKANLGKKTGDIFQWGTTQGIIHSIE
jgi:hypothetical protein